MRWFVGGLSVVSFVFWCGCAAEQSPVPDGTPSGGRLPVVGSEQIDRGAAVKALRCEYKSNPEGIDVLRPRLSWVIEAEGRGWKQGAYQILVAGSRENLGRQRGDLWNSGKVASEQTNQIVYGGKKLSSGRRCWWMVRVWDVMGNVSDWSGVACWSMGLLKGSDWKAKWIGDGVVRMQKVGREERWGDWVDKYDRYYYPCTYYRKEFSLTGEVRRAGVYVTARGLYELYVNGQRVGQDYFTPGWSVHEKRYWYQAYDITELLKSGANAIGAIVGDGWYVMLNNKEYVGKKTALLAQVVIEYTDGGKERVVTDGSWEMTTDGPILSSDIYNGEEYDARKELAGWAEPNFRNPHLEPVVVLEDEGARLTRHPGEAIRRTMEIEPVEVSEPEPNVFVFDMGQNFSGWARLKVEGKAGIKVQLRFAEMLNEDGTIYTENLRSAKATDTYILKGNGVEQWEPRFTYHGFRYVEVTGYPGRPGADAVTGIVVRSDAPIASSFECLNEMLNKLYSNILWGQQSNYWETPTDCPQRDERLGWTGDAQVFIRTGAYNMDVAAFFTAWLRTLNDNQYPDGQYPVIAPVGDEGSSAGWSDAGIICPWVIYEFYGDKQILAEHYDGMCAWVAYMEGTSRELVRDVWGFGDWLNLDEVETPKPVINTAYFAYSTKLLSKIARVLGREKDAQRYEELFEQIKSAFNRAFVAEDGKITGDTQTAYLLALSFDLVDAQQRRLAEDYLIRRIEEKDWHLSTGFLGVNLLLPTLTEMGRLDVAYRLLTNEDYPSWLYSIHQGATTVWERWNSFTKADGFGDAGMNSFNHYAYGSCGEWMFSTIAGIGVGEPGYKHVTIRPRPGGDITYARASYESIRGEIMTDWRIEGSSFKLDIEIPANTGATVYVPVKQAGLVTEGGVWAEKADGVQFLGMEDGAAVFEVGSGRYEFESEM